jgi:copper homeostasis protein
MDQLIDLGITRILTSGQEPDVSLGTETVREMIAYAAGRIQILPGAGITSRNFERVIAETGCDQVHVIAQRTYYDRSVENNRAIYYGGALYPAEDRFQMIDRDAIGNLVSRLPG